MPHEYCLYGFRHSFCTKILNKTKDPHLVRHADISITAKHYINRDTADIKKSLARSRPLIFKLWISDKQINRKNIFYLFFKITTYRESYPYTSPTRISLKTACYLSSLSFILKYPIILCQYPKTY